MTGTMTLAEIRACLEAGDFTLHGVDDADDWKEEADRYNAGTLIAFASNYTDFFGVGRDTRLDWSGFFKAFGNTYRGRWDSPGAFARHIAEQMTDFGTPQEQRGRREFLKRYTDVIDWEADAVSRHMSDYVMVRVYPDVEGDRAVYAFEPTA